MRTSSVHGMAAGRVSYRRGSGIAAAVILLALGNTAARSSDEAVSTWPNTVRFQPLETGKRGRDILKLRAYDQVGSPSCSRDGRWVAFDAYKVASPELSTPAECWVVRTEGTGLTKLADGATPRWSPDGKRLVFMREGKGDPERDLGIFVIDRDGTGQRRIGPGRWPDWSPDGSRIAYSSGGPEGGGARPKASIFIARVDGTGVRMLCEGDCPSWSPDGRRIACCLVGPDRPYPRDPGGGCRDRRERDRGSRVVPRGLVARRQESGVQRTGGQG